MEIRESFSCCTTGPNTYEDMRNTSLVMLKTNLKKSNVLPIRSDVMSMI
jgi:hypothetical protein